MRRWWQGLLAIGWVVVCYAPATPEAMKAQPGAVLDEERQATAAAEPRIPADASQAEVYRRVKELAEEYLRPRAPRPVESWHRPWNPQQAFSEFEGFRQRVSYLEDASGQLPGFGGGGPSRMFAVWKRLLVQGVETPQESDAAVPPRGGPDDEVVLASGELVLSHTDLSMPRRGGIGFSLVRYFRSQVEYNGPLGPGWDHNCNQRIVAEGTARRPQRLVWFTGQRAIRFERRNERWEPEEGAFYRLQMEADRIQIDTADLVRFEFEPAREPGGGGLRWRIARIAGRHDQGRANVLRFEYWPGSDVLRAVEDPFGNRVRFLHDSQGRLSAVECGAVCVLYRYDASGRLKEVRVPRVATRLAHVEDISWSYENVTGIDGRNWLRSVIAPGSFAEKAFAYEMKAEKPGYGRVVKVSLRGRDPRASAEEAVWQFAARVAGNVQTVTYQPPKPLPAEEWTFAVRSGRVDCYPSARRVPSQKAEWRWQHNGAGQMVEEQRPLGGITRWHYDATHPDPRFRGNLLEKEEAARPGANPLSIAKRGWRWKYHPAIALPQSAVVYEVSREGKERVLLESRFEYDPQDFNAVREQVGEKTRRTVWNRFGLPVVEWDARGCATVRRYYSQFTAGVASGKYGGLEAESVADASTAKVEAALREIGGKNQGAGVPSRQAEGPPCERTSQFRYDRQGRMVQEQHPDYRVARLWNKLGQALAVLDSRTDLTVYDYDTALRRTGQWRRILRLKDAPYAGETRADAAGYFLAEQLTYDALGRLASWNPTREPMGSDKPAPPEVRYEYYPSGQLKKRTSAAGTAVEIRYDEHTGREETVRLLNNKNASDALTLRSAMSYDAEGFLLSYRDARDAQYRAEPDGFGREFATIRPNGVRTETERDGLDRPIREQVKGGDDRLLAERTFEYDPSGRLVKVMHHRRLAVPPAAAGQKTGIDEWLVSEEMRYDPEGNVVARRQLRPNAWQKFGYDGLGRLVWQESPEGDRWQAFFQGDWPSVETQVLCGQPEKKRTFTLHTVTLRDDRGQPWCVVPVGHDGTVGIGRSTLTLCDSEGRVVLEVQPDIRTTRRYYNTLGLVDREVLFGAGDQGKPLSETKNHYGPDGLLARRELFNEPLVFRPSNQPPLWKVERKPVPQVRQMEYDGFRRLQRETAPDGLVQEYAYGPDSRVTTLTRYHVAEPKHKEILGFTYDPLGRLTAVEDKSGKDPQRTSQTVQKFEYDGLDNVVRAEDNAQPDYPLAVERSYDNFGQLLSERVVLHKEGRPMPAIEYHYDSAAGKQQVRLAGLEQQPAGWRVLEVQQDLAGRIQEIRKDGQEFCRLEYFGQQEAARWFSGHGLREEITRFDPFLDPLEQRLTEQEPPGEKAAGEPVYCMHYLRDPLGRVIASSVRVPQQGWECSKFYDRDSAGNLSAEDMQSKFHEPAELGKVRRDLLESPASPRTPIAYGVHHVRRFEYDQAGNLIASFRDRKVADQWPSGTELASSWDPEAPRPQVAGSPPSPRVLLTSFSTPGPAETQTSAVDAQGLQDRALASNRIACKAQVEVESPCQAKLVARYEYDCFGRLQSYHSRATGKALRWQIEYDVLGRVMGMKGFDAERQDVPQQPERPAQAERDSGQPRYELRLAYDPFNRRIVKEVRDFKPGRDSTADAPQRTVTVDVMLYSGQRPAAKLRKPADPAKPWSIEGQYIWGTGPSKVLAYYERASVQSQSGPEQPIMREYLLHQDVALNVVLSTGFSLENRPEKKVEVYDVASYWGFGQNGTTGIVRAIECSLDQEQGREENWATDRVVDEHSAHWIGKAGPGFLTLKLAQQQRLTGTDIWADNFPDKFRVYVVSEGDAPPPGNPLTTWEKKHQAERVFDSDAWHAQGAGRGPGKLRQIPLGGRRGQQIVFVWDDGHAGVQVREFEVFVQPLHPGDLAFSGAIYDAESGLYYHGARYRLPELGTFISPDPLGFAGGDNLYAFAHNDPLTWHDPDGRLAHILLGAGTGAVLGAGIYIYQWWWYGEEWSWARFGVYTAAGAAGGAVAVSTFGLAQSLLGGSWLAKVGSGAAAGAFSGVTHGAISAGGITYLETGDLGASLRAAGKAAAYEGALGAALGGAIGGAVARLSRYPARYGASPPACRQTAVHREVVGVRPYRARYGQDAAAAVKAVNAAADVTGGVRSFESFHKLKAALGPAGDGMEWHHIVEQRPSNIIRFGPEAIHNTENVVAVPTWANQKIAAYYSSKPLFTQGKTVRQWLDSLSYEEEMEFGRKILDKVLKGQSLR